MDQIAPRSSRSPSSSSGAKIIIQRIIAITSIILLSHYYPSQASSSYYQSFHSSPSDTNENGNSSSRGNKQRKKAGETDETRERSQSLLSSSSSQSSQLLNDSYRRTPENTSKQQYPSQQYHHFKWKKNSMDRAPGNHHRDNDSSIYDELYEEDDKIGVPPVRIGGMILNPNHDIDPDETDTRPFQNTALTDTDTNTSTKRKEAIPRRHRRYKDMLPKQNNKPTEASLLQLPCSLLLRTSTRGSGGGGGGTTSNAVPIATYLDTGAQVTVMTMQAAKRAGLAHLIDGRYAGRAIGVAGVSCGVLGRIPARTVSLVFSGCRSGDGGGSGGNDCNGGGSVVVVDRSPAIFVLEEGIGGSGNGDGVELLLGLDSLEDWSAGICLRDRTLTIRSMNISGGGGGGDVDGEDSVVVSFVNTSGVSGESGHNTKIPTPKETPHRPQRSMPNMRSSPSSSIPYVGTVTSQRMPATDLESDLDLLDSTNTGASSYHGADKPTPAVLLRERGGSQENDNLYDDDYYGDDDYSDTDFDYDSCNLSGI